MLEYYPRYQGAVVVGDLFEATPNSDAYTYGTPIAIRDDGDVEPATDATQADYIGFAFSESTEEDNLAFLDASGSWKVAVAVGHWIVRLRFSDGCLATGITFEPTDLLYIDANSDWTNAIPNAGDTPKGIVVGAAGSGADHVIYAKFDRM